MIQTAITHRCTKCNSTSIVKNGTDYKGDQKFHCLDCDAYRERASMRGVERIFGIARQTLTCWIIEKTTALPDLADTLEAARADDVLELDELWSFAFRKSDKRWIWIALCRRTRQAVAYFIGDRSHSPSPTLTTKRC